MSRPRAKTIDLKPLSPLKELEGYSKTRVQQGLEYADRLLASKDKNRKVTPITQKVLAMYSTTCRSLLNKWSTSPQAIIDQSRTEIRYYESALEQNEFMRPMEGEARQKFLESIINLRELEYYSRYGDYVSGVATDLRFQAKNHGVKGWELIGGDKRWSEIVEKLDSKQEKWSEISRGLRLEDPKGMTAKEKLKNLDLQDLAIHRVIRDTCLAADLDFDTVLFSIHAYAERNELMHAHMKKLLETGDTLAIAHKLSQDRKELPMVIPVEKAVDEVLMRTVIEGLIKVWFDTRGNLDQPIGWSPTIELANEIAKAQSGLSKKQKTTKAEEYQVNKSRSLKKMWETMQREGEDRALIEIMATPYTGPDLPDPVALGLRSAHTAEPSSPKKRKASSQLTPTPSDHYKGYQAAFDRTQSAWIYATQQFQKRAEQSWNDALRAKDIQRRFHIQYGPSNEPPPPSSSVPTALTLGRLSIAETSQPQAEDLEESLPPGWEKATSHETGAIWYINPSKNRIRQDRPK